MYHVFETVFPDKQVHVGFGKGDADAYGKKLRRTQWRNLAPLFRQYGNQAATTIVASDPDRMVARQQKYTIMAAHIRSGRSCNEKVTPSSRWD